ncbi:hypothetical protein Tsubulata_020771 [Turnera subulata]|uniref:60S ribosomal protein L7a n=1 Tax=Turnera subulata TaxID=218843 RepID=A0A9Q0IZH3_9ROSI|nr:hypothetical protein Tsubulata_020771 [Turnera subulata]
MFTLLVFCKLATASNLFKILLKYRPEDRAAKKERLLNKAQAEAEGKSTEAKKPIIVKYGLNHITYLIEQEDGDLLLHCEGKISLGSHCPQENCISFVLDTVRNADKLEFSRILEAIKANFNDKYDEYRKEWGGGIMGSKSQAKEKILARETAQRMA